MGSGFDLSRRNVVFYERRCQGAFLSCVYKVANRTSGDMGGTLGVDGSHGPPNWLRGGVGLPNSSIYYAKTVL
jgi:hypothetical protein